MRENFYVNNCPFPWHSYFLILLPYLKRTLQDSDFPPPVSKVAFRRNVTTRFGQFPPHMEQIRMLHGDEGVPLSPVLGAAGGDNLARLFPTRIG